MIRLQDRVFFGLATAGNLDKDRQRPCAPVPPRFPLSCGSDLFTEKDEADRATCCLFGRLEDGTCCSALQWLTHVNTKKTPVEDYISPLTRTMFGVFGTCTEDSISPLTLLLFPVLNRRAG